VLNWYIECAVSLVLKLRQSVLSMVHLVVSFSKSPDLPLSVAIFGSKLVESSMLLHWVDRRCCGWSVSVKPWWQTLAASHEKS
jgi:hypothetical protein